MYYVYVLRSTQKKYKFYIGYTNNLKRRLVEHKNAQPNDYARRYVPWKLETFIAFTNKRLAKQFEVYLKSHSGRAFLKRRLMAAE